MRTLPLINSAAQYGSRLRSPSYGFVDNKGLKLKASWYSQKSRSPSSSASEPPEVHAS